MSDYLLGIDIGTSACKVALFTENGSVVEQENKGYPVFYPEAGWAEQDPSQWWEAVCAAVRLLLRKAGVQPEQIAAIGVDGQSWSVIPVDRHGAVLRRTPIWTDTRAKDICLTLKQRFGEERLFEVSGNPLQPTYALPKLLWYREHEPQMYSQTAKLLQSNSYIVWKLTGEMTQDLSQCYGFSCFNMRKGVWDETLCREMGIDTALFPPLCASDQIVGHVTQSAAQSTGLAAGTPVVAGGLDAACGALGAGVIEDGDTQEQGGQAGGMSICLSKYQAEPRLILGYHVLAGKWLLQGGTTGGCGVENWLARELAAAERQKSESVGSSVFAEMDRAAAQITGGSEGLVFLPYMAGERSPIWNPDAKGVFFGLDFSKTRAHMYRAALEGVAYSLRHNLETAAQAGITVRQMRAMGGAANSALWMQIKADVTGIPIAVAKSDAATTLGAVMLAGVACGMYSSYREAVERTVQTKRQFQPDLQLKAVYDRGYDTYLRLYEQLKNLM